MHKMCQQCDEANEISEHCLMSFCDTCCEGFCEHQQDLEDGEWNCQGMIDC